MREIKGYICIARDSLGRLLFGKSRDKNRTYENFETNSLTPYETREEAQKAYEELSKRQDFKELKIAGIEFRIAETEEEIGLLQQPYVLVRKVNFGSWKEERISESMDNIEKAREKREEVIKTQRKIGRRISKNSIKLASFKLT